ncbi:hypothetical protein [Amycolatopsis sp. NPDC003731]
MVAAVGFGGVIWTQLATARRERRRREREERERGRVLRAELYAEFYRVMAEFRRIAEEYGTGRVSKADATALRDRLRQVADDGADVFGRLRLLAAPAVVDAAEAVINATDRYQGALLRGGSTEDDLARMQRSLKTAVDAMRTDVNPGEPVTSRRRVWDRLRRADRLRSVGPGK